MGYEAVNAALGRMIASVPESKTMAVHDAFSKVVSKDVPPYLMSTVNEADAKKAYAALMEFKDVVKANPITPSAAAPVSNPAIDAAAGKLASAAYPFLASAMSPQKVKSKTNLIFLKCVCGQASG